jgi:hypothetical protein
MREEKKDHHPVLHTTSQLDSRFSFNNDNSDSERVEIDPIHKAVGKESWYQVSLKVKLRIEDYV